VARVLAAVSRSAGGDGGGVFVLLLIAVAIVAPWIAPFDAENYFDYDRLNDGPSMMHWFGVDSLGRDIFSRVLVGAQISLAAGVLAVFIGAAIGTVLGLLAGYYEGWWDRIIMRICDVLFAFPGILLAIAVVAVMGSGMSNVIIAVAIFSIPAFARLVRGNTLVLKQQTFIESARSIGASDATILFNHICPERYHRLWSTLRCVSGCRLSPLPACHFWGLARSRRRRSGGDAQRGAGGYGDGAARGAVPGNRDFSDGAGV
jgi:ABC-type dipeptide/oligopeptide/nickel transport system permease subunit